MRWCCTKFDFEKKIHFTTSAITPCISRHFLATASEPLVPNSKNLRNNPKSPGFRLNARKYCIFHRRHFSPKRDIKKLNDSLCGHAFYFLNGTQGEEKGTTALQKWNKCLKIMSEVMIPAAETNENEGTGVKVLRVMMVWSLFIFLH